MVSPFEVADVLARDMGLSVGIAYAKRVAQRASDGAYAVCYEEAARILQTRLDGLRASCLAGSLDMGVLP